MKSLIDRLKENKRIPMHMPGHKRNVLLSPYLEKLSADIDITEIDGFDNLHDPDGILKESMEKAASIRGARKAFYLVNGSTCGILASICALIGKGDTVICARNCHKSVYNALELCGARVVFVNPMIDKKTGICGSLNPDNIEEKINSNPDAKLIVLTSPTYEGVVSDVRKICEVSHKKRIPVLVDAAHGAHFGFAEGFPESASSCGADISVESLHKTLPSLTQTAICYISGDLVCEDDVAEKLSIFQTSSPSYILMASIDECINLLKKQKNELFKDWNGCLDEFYKNAETFRNIRILKNDGNFFDLDKSKIVILAKDGKRLLKLLRDEGVECEMAMPGYVVAMTGMGDTKESMDKLFNALYAVDEYVEKGDARIPDISSAEVVLSVGQAKNEPMEYLEYMKSVGRVSGEYVWAYPPGVPIIIPGEKVSEEVAQTLIKYEEYGFNLQGSKKRKAGEILVIK